MTLVLVFFKKYVACSLEKESICPLKTGRLLSFWILLPGKRQSSISPGELQEGLERPGEGAEHLSDQLIASSRWKTRCLHH